MHLLDQLLIILDQCGKDGHTLGTVGQTAAAFARGFHLHLRAARNARRSYLVETAEDARFKWLNKGLHCQEDDAGAFAARHVTRR